MPFLVLFVGVPSLLISCFQHHHHVHQYPQHILSSKIKKSCIKIIIRFRGAGVSGEIRMSGDNAQIWMEGEVDGHHDYDLDDDHHDHDHDKST